MEKITSKTADNGLGDIELVTDIIDSIIDSTNGTLSTNLTKSILQSVSNLMQSDLKVDVTPKSQDITQRYTDEQLLVFSDDRVTVWTLVYLVESTKYKSKLCSFSVWLKR